MVTNNPSIEPTTPAVPSQTSETKEKGKAEESPVNKIGTGTLGTKEAENKPKTTQVSQKSIAAVPAERGPFDQITRFFRRHLKLIKDDEKILAKQIGASIELVDCEIRKAHLMAKEAKVGEKEFAHQFSSKESIEYSKASLKVAKEQLDKANSSAEKLVADYKENAEHLREEHAHYDFLPKEIESLKKEIVHLEKRIKVQEKLLALEETIANCPLQKTWEGSNKTWDKFDEVNKQRKDLGETLKTMLLDTRPNDKEIQKYLKKETLSSSDMHTLIKRFFPDLNPKFERLFNNILDLQENRIKNLNAHTANIKREISQYHEEQEKKIESKVEILTGKSLWNRIYKTFNPETKLKTQIEDAQKESLTTYEKIEKDVGLISAEEEPDRLMDWMDEMKKIDPDLAEQQVEIVSLRNQFSQLEKRKNIGDQIDALGKLFAGYKAGKNGIKISDDQVPLGADLRGNIGTTRASILIQIKDLALTVREFPTKEKLGQLDLETMKELIITKYPDLKNRMERLVELIDGQEKTAGENGLYEQIVAGIKNPEAETEENQAQIISIRHKKEAELPPPISKAESSQLPELHEVQAPEASTAQTEKSVLNKIKESKESISVSSSSLDPEKAIRDLRQPPQVTTSRYMSPKKSRTKEEILNEIKNGRITKVAEEFKNAVKENKITPEDIDKLKKELNVIQITYLDKLISPPPKKEL